MHYIPKKTLETIIETSNHFVVTVKKNAQKLYKLIDEQTKKLTSRKSYHRSDEKGHGRQVRRMIHVFEANEAIKEYFHGIKSVIRIKRIKKIKETIATEVIFYVSDLEISAKEFLKGIRNHWSIENNLHWVKDVVFLEDKTYYNNSIAPKMSLIKSMVISIAYINSNSVTNFQRTNAHDIELMSRFIE